jgi:hypothetical protein
MVDIRGSLPSKRIEEPIDKRLRTIGIGDIFGIEVSISFYHIEHSCTNFFGTR